MTDSKNIAPGAPGMPARWTSSAKQGVGTALGTNSRVWFTISHGIFNEIYYPRVDQACTRDMGLIVTDGQDFFSEEKRHTDSAVRCLAPGVPAYFLANTCKQGRYRIEKKILTDPRRDTVLQQTTFVPQQGQLADYHVYVLLAPHLGNRGGGNTAWLGDYKGVPMLFAQRADYTLALACSAPWLKRSTGYVGASDGWQDLKRHKEMKWTYDRAEDGNICLTAEIDLTSADGQFLLSLGFGRNQAEAGQRALASLQDGFEAAQAAYVASWQKWQADLKALDPPNKKARNLYRISTAVIRTHEAKRFPGGIIASLSVPWGATKGDDDLGGYHLIWPRDLVEAAGGLLAAGARQDACRVLTYLQVTQEADGHWAQNAWLDGTPYWRGLQMDETAFPILLVDLARREGALDKDRLARLWPMVRRAAAYLLRNGPVTPEDRWEEDPGLSPFTLAVEIAALVVAADMAQQHGETDVVGYLLETADAWNAHIEAWTYVRDTSLADDVGVEGYYVRIAPPEVAEAASPINGFVPIKNRPPGNNEEPAVQMVSPDALALVRFGLRAADDARVLNTIKVIDSQLKVETPNGPAWHRYNGDGYGEHKDGAPFDGVGIGRAWPLFTGERGHYELANGHARRAQALLKAMESFSDQGGLIPEQVWDSDDIPDRELYLGQPTGSAMPLVWAHAECLKLRRSLQEGTIFDMPPQTAQRYLHQQHRSPHAIWRFNHKARSFPAGKRLRIEVLQPATIRWSADGWSTTHDVASRDTGLGVYVADLPTERVDAGRTIIFTFRWTEQDRWEDRDFEVTVVKTKSK